MIIESAAFSFIELFKKLSLCHICEYLWHVINHWPFGDQDNSDRIEPPTYIL